MFAIIFPSDGKTSDAQPILGFKALVEFEDSLTRVSVLLRIKGG
jgi:hypothetical protein